MVILPAIDMKDGECVRLVQGDMNQATVFSSNPVEMAQKWVAQGAEILHLVDLNGAFAKKPVNLNVVKQIIATVNIPVELGGGIRDLATLETVFNLGVHYAIIGTAAVDNPDLVKEACLKWPGKIRVGIDAKGGMVAVNGWAEVTNVRAIDLANRFADYGVDAIIYTDIARDGLLKGVNVDECANLAKEISIPVIASGGLATLEDIKALKEHEAIGISGVIAGKAIYTGAIDLATAIALGKR